MGEVIRFEIGLVSFIGREITISVLGRDIAGNYGGEGTESLKGNVDGCKGCDGRQRTRRDRGMTKGVWR